MSRLTPRVLWLVLGVGCLALVGGSLILTAWMDLRPCGLCIFQRLLFIVLGLLALAAAGLGPRRGVLVPGLLALACAAAGVGIAVYQLWVQVQPAESVSCVGGDLTFIDLLVDWLGQRLPTLFLATGFCEDTGPLILGLSLAGWALVGFSGCLVVGVWALASRGRAHA